MKKKILSLLTTVSLFFASLISCGAKGIEATTLDNEIKFETVLNAFKGCVTAQLALTFTIIVIVLFFVFRKKLSKKLDNTNSASMMNAFLIFFSVFGIGCLAMAFISDGATWSHLMHYDPHSESVYSQFSDFILSIQKTGKRQFVELADQFTPLGILMYYIIAQFMPTKYVLSDSMIDYIRILRDQTFMFLYLILVMLCIVLVYRMNRAVLRRNELKIRDELVAFLTVVSYPTMYCVERGNIAGIGIVLVLFFILYYDSSNQAFRELSHLALGISAALNPITIFLVFLMVDIKKKRAFSDIVKTCMYALILFVTPCISTGFDCIGVYFRTMFTVTAEAFVPANMSIGNLLLFFGIDNQMIIQIITITMNLVSIISIFILPKTWQKISAVIYIILNVFALSSPVNLIFIFIPLVLLLSESKHKTSDWIYLLIFALLVTPFPEWFWTNREQFNLFMLSLGIKNIRNANNLISLAAVQSLFITNCYIIISRMESRKVRKQKAVDSQTKEQTDNVQPA